MLNVKVIETLIWVQSNKNLLQPSVVNQARHKIPHQIPRQGKPSQAKLMLCQDTDSIQSKKCSPNLSVCKYDQVLLTNSEQTVRQVFKNVLKHEIIFHVGKTDQRLGHYTLKYVRDYFLLWSMNLILEANVCTAIRCKKL